MADKKEKFSYKRDSDGHLMCNECDFKPKPTTKHPKGNPSTLHYHLKSHEGNFAFECKTCKKSFLQKLTLTNHILSRHPELNEKIVTFNCPEPNCEFKSITKDL